MAWKPPKEVIAARNSIGLKDVLLHLHQAPIDKPENSQSGSVAQGFSTENGSMSGLLNPMTTSIGKPVGAAPQIKFKQPSSRLLGRVKHTLGSSLGKKESM